MSSVSLPRIGLSKAQQAQLSPARVPLSQETVHGMGTNKLSLERMGTDRPSHFAICEARHLQSWQEAHRLTDGDASHVVEDTQRGKPVFRTSQYGMGKVGEAR